MTWQNMQEEVAAGRVRNIGVSNFGIRNLQGLLSHPTCTIVPAVNQLEVSSAHGAKEVRFRKTTHSFNRTSFIQ